jgi:nucleoside-diphosphate-sugar epimerase
MMLYITGTSGFVGTNLVSSLSLLDVKIVKLGRQDLEEVSPRTFTDGSVIIHLAGKAHDLRKVSNPDDYDAVNFGVTKRLYDAFLLSDTKDFIFISSVKAAADQVNGILTEEHVPNPKTHYGMSKLKAEKYIQDQPLPEGKSYYILRPCMIHGPGNKGNLNLLYQIVKKGIPYPLAGFENKRSFLSIENLCFIIKELIIRNDIVSGVYNIADDEALSTNEVVSILSSSLKKRARLWKIPPSLIRFGAKIGDKLHLPLTTERLDKLTESYVVSNYKIVTAINKALPLSAKDGLNITALSFQKS